MCNRLPEIKKNGDAGIFPVYYSLKLMYIVINLFYYVLKLILFFLVWCPCMVVINIIISSSS